MNKRVVFILPGSSGSPTGGSRIVYEYANRLAHKGYEVCVVHAPVTRIDPGWKMLAKALIRYPQRYLDKSYRPDSWFAVNHKVKVLWKPSLSARFIPDADIVIATAWKTAEWVAAYPAEKGRKFYFIQHYEDWDAPSERIDATWGLPLQKIVIAKWLKLAANKMGESAVYVPNAIDHAQFHVEIAPSNRNPSRIVMLYHNHPWKGTDDGLSAIARLKRARPDIQVALFGVPERPAGLPSWIEYHCNPKQAELRQLYNGAALFLAPSHSEGWGLTALEAMACGAAVVATNNQGHLEFAVDRENALLVKVSDIEGMVKALDILMSDEVLRLSIAAAGAATAERFTWERSVSCFEEALFSDDGTR